MVLNLTPSAGQKCSIYTASVSPPPQNNCWDVWETGGGGTIVHSPPGSRTLSTHNSGKQLCMWEEQLNNDWQPNIPMFYWFAGSFATWIKHGHGASICADELQVRPDCTVALKRLLPSPTGRDAAIGQWNNRTWPAASPLSSTTGIHYSCDTQIHASPAIVLDRQSFHRYWVQDISHLQCKPEERPIHPLSHDWGTRHYSIMLLPTTCFIQLTNNYVIDAGGSGVVLPCVQKLLLWHWYQPAFAQKNRNSVDTRKLAMSIPFNNRAQ